jgi:serine/threonine-protein kinase
MWVRIAAVAAFVAAATVVGWSALVHAVHSGTLAVPDLRGMTPETARQQAHDLGLDVDVDPAGVFSPSVPVGEIADQEPLPGFHVKTGSVVVVRESLGSERVSVPPVAGDSVAAAIGRLEQAGLVVGTRVVVQGAGRGEGVLTSAPAPGTEVPPGSTVDLLVNATPRRPTWVMPSLLSSSEAEVARLCRAHQLRLGQVHEVPYPGLPPGLVLRQYPPAGSPMRQSDIVAVWVSQ